MPTRVVHAAPLVSRWIRAHVDEPFVIGPDRESEQWVSAVAKGADAPYTVLEKLRRGDRDVEISVKNLPDLEGRTPVLVDDIISTGRTMIEAVRLIMSQGGGPPVCVAVHGLFAEHCDRLLAQAGARVVTSNSVPHETNNGIDVTQLLVNSVSAVWVCRQSDRRSCERSLTAPMRLFGPRADFDSQIPKSAPGSRRLKGSELVLER